MERLLTNITCAVDLDVIDNAIKVVYNTIETTKGEMRESLYWVLVDMLQTYERAVGITHPVDECLPDLLPELESA